jgi:hypothetical protein
MIIIIIIILIADKMDFTEHEVLRYINVLTSCSKCVRLSVHGFIRSNELKF